MTPTHPKIQTIILYYIYYYKVIVESAEEGVIVWAVLCGPRPICRSAYLHDSVVNSKIGDHNMLGKKQGTDIFSVNSIYLRFRVIKLIYL